MVFKRCCGFKYVVSILEIMLLTVWSTKNSWLNDSSTELRFSVDVWFVLDYDYYSGEPNKHSIDVVLNAYVYQEPKVA